MGARRSVAVALAPANIVALSAADEREYGEWHRMGLANGHLAELTGANAREGTLTVGLLANCTSVLGMLGGLQHQDPSGVPARVALVFIEAHGDFNVPETMLSGMLGGMPVAVSAGLARAQMERLSGVADGPTSVELAGALKGLRARTPGS